MRRLKKTETKRKAKRSSSVMQVVQVDDNRALQTFDHSNVAWKVADTFLKSNPFKGIVDGALVRMIPPHDATDAKVDHVRGKIYEAGAEKVKLLPRAAAPLVVNDDGDDESQLVEAESAIAFRTPRKVIDGMVNTSFTDRKEELAELVNEYLGRAEANKPAGKEFTAVEVGHITGIRLKNWMCFNGEFELELEPKVYSITAQDEEDPERSNWLGKSSLLGAIVFAMTGKYPTKTADGWINGAEKSGGVDLQFSSGLFIGRWKDRGKSTQLEVVVDEESDPMNGQTAQRFIDEAIVDYDTLERTAYLKQKSTDRFVTMGPAERSETVNGWLGTGWIEEAGRMCRDDLSGLTAKDAGYRANLTDIEKRYESPIATLIIETQTESQLLSLDVMTAKDVVKEAQELKAASVEWERANRAHTLYEELSARFDKLGDAEPRGSVGDVEELTRSSSKAGEEELLARREFKTSSDVAQGKFDGDCPVAGIKCPATAQINKQGAPSRTRCENAKATWDSKKSCSETASAALNSHKKATRQVTEWESKRSALTVEMSRLKPDYDFIHTSAGRPQEPADDVLESYESAVKNHSESVATLKRLLADSVAVETLTDKIAKLQPQIEIHRSALMILGRSGAQRAIAEGALAQIERVGNKAILESGIGLSFQVKWSQETKKLAEACDHCGSPFPSSQRVKQCTRCGTDRGRKLSHELRIVLSNSSGGADDLAGAMFQLSAANWLREYEGSTWSVFLIDEPFGSLDVANVRGLSRHLGQLLGDQFGASQSFIVAHHADVLESTPGRIHITSSNGKSRVEVYG